jgi:hypothetical protein
MWWFLVEFIVGGLTFAMVYCIWRRLQEVQITAESDKTPRVAEMTPGSGSVLADRLDKLDAATQGWKKRVGPTDAVQFSVAGRMMTEQVVRSPLTRADDETLTPALLSPPAQLVGHTSAQRTRKTPRPERFRSKAGE